MSDRSIVVALIGIALGLATLGTPARARAHAGPPPPDLVQPVAKNTVTFEYPPELLARPEPPSGRVVVKLVVGVDGVPKELAIERGVAPEIDARALEAVAQLRYEPGRHRGQPVEIVMRVALDVVVPRIEPPAPAPATAPATKPALGGTTDPPSKPAAAPPVRVHGRVLEAGQRTPMARVTVTAIPAPPGIPVGRIKKRIYEPPSTPAWTVEATTAADGSFELRGVPDGRVRIVVTTPGFERLEFVEELQPREIVEVTYYQTRTSTNPYRTVVKVTREEREEVARRTISVAEINNLPGTQGDALKALQNFPGIARSPFGIGLLVVRGQAPSSSAIYLGYHEIPQLFHFGGLTSVFNSDILTQIDFVPGNFDSRYGDAVGGIVNVVPRKGRRDGYHGYVDSDLFDTGVLFEGPIGKGSFILSARRSYIDLLLPRVIPDDAGLDFTLAPRYYDYQGLFDYPVSGGNLSVRVFGSDDRAKLVSTNPNEVDVDDRNRFESTIFFHRVDLAYEKQLGPWSFLITPSYRHDYVSLGIGELFRFGITTDTLSSRAELTRRIGHRASWRTGTEFLFGRYGFKAEAPPVPPGDVGSTDQRFATEQGGLYTIPALYSTLTLGLGERFTLYPGVRFTYYHEPFLYTTTDPRLRFAWQVADRTTIKGGIGLYSQAPEPQEYDKTWGNPRIGPERAVHNSLGVAQEFARGIKLELTGFYNHFWNLATPSRDLVVRPDGTIGSENFASQGIGRAFGMEFLGRKELTRNLFGWASYTLMRSQRQDEPGDPFVLFDLDQTHILTLVLVYKLPRNWQIGARFRLVSGNPTTPVIGSIYDASQGNYQPINGPRNSDRVPAFHQLDVRVDKRWVWKRMSLTAYLDILNAYNHQNVEFRNYSFDYRRSQPVAGLPIIPSVGMKLEY